MAGPRFKPGSFVEERDAYGNVTLLHGNRCSHCKKLVTYSSQRDMFKHLDVCRGCMSLVCLDCAGKPCKTWIEKVDEWEKAGHRRDRDLERAAFGEPLGQKRSE